MKRNLNYFLLTSGTALILTACASIPSGQADSMTTDTTGMQSSDRMAEDTQSSGMMTEDTQASGMMTEDTQARDMMAEPGKNQPKDSMASDKTSGSGEIFAAVDQYFKNLPEDQHMITPDEVFQKMERNENMVLIDVRGADAYEDGHLVGAFNIPYGPDLTQALSLIPDDVSIYVNCYTGQLGSQAAALLNLAGKHAFNIEGGWNNGISQTANYETHSTREPAPLMEGSYPVSEAIVNAMERYFADAAKSSSFNFPAAELAKAVKAGNGKYTILSVRDAASYQSGHIEGAINIPFGTEMRDQLSTLPKDKPIVVYSQTGQLSSQILTILRFLGYEAYSLSGGIDGDSRSWIGNGYPVVK